MSVFRRLCGLGAFVNALFFIMNLHNAETGKAYISLIFALICAFVFAFPCEKEK